MLGKEIPCFLHKQLGLVRAILFLFPIFTSSWALFRNSVLDGLHPPISTRLPGPSLKPWTGAQMHVCVAWQQYTWCRGWEEGDSCPSHILGSGWWQACASVPDSVSLLTSLVLSGGVCSWQGRAVFGKCVSGSAPWLRRA